MLVRVFIVCGMTLALSACSTTPVDLRYAPTEQSNISRPQHRSILEISSVTDYRSQPSNYIGAIRGGFGNRLNTLESPITVKELVQRGFADALRARGLLAQAGNGRYALDVGIRRFDSSQLVRREAHVHFNIGLVDRSSGRRVYEKDVSVDRVAGGIRSLDSGGFGSTEDLRRLANETMQAAIDEALNEPAFLSAISGS